jgi:hypothetical protein
MGKKAREAVGVLTSTGLICDIPRTGVWVGRFTGAPAEIQQLLGRLGWVEVDDQR